MTIDGVQALFDPGAGRLVGRYFRLVAFFYAFGALVHAGNLVGLGHAAADAPAYFRVLDVAYLLLDVSVVWGLWTRRWWGVGLFFLAALSQLVLYLGFPHAFSRTDEERRAIMGLVQFHVGALAVYGVLRWLGK